VRGGLSAHFADQIDAKAGREFAGPGDKVVVPPGWAHSVINADPQQRMMFGAWCDRQYGFVYDAIRAHHGLAWFPVLDAEGNIHWESNPSYRFSSLSIRNPRLYPELSLDPNTPMYQQFADDPDSIQWVSQPALVAPLWTGFEM
jgi:glucose-6-phosphate isomerase